MILAFIEDGSLKVFESDAEACREFEGVDVESGVVTFYSDDGVFLKPEFTTPNTYGRYFGMFGWSRSGEYRLVPEAGAKEDPLWLALLETSHLEPNGDFETLDALKLYLAKKGVQVEDPDP